MKIQRSELKMIVKECLKELISEGAFNNLMTEAMGSVPQQQLAPPYYGQPQPYGPPRPMNPAARATAQSMAKTPEEAALYETIFADSHQTMMAQDGASVDPRDIARYQQANYQQYQQQQYFEQPQNGYYQQPQYAPQQPQQPQYMHRQNAMQQGQPPRGGNRWADLAFNSPIKNRPISEEGGPGPSGGRMGANMGKFD